MTPSHVIDLIHPPNGGETRDNWKLSMYLADYLSENAPERLEADGYLLVRISEVDRERVIATFEAASAFFQESQDQKSLCKLPDDMGYRPLGIEYSKSPSYPDQIESFSVSTRLNSWVSELRLTSAQVLYRQMLSTFGIFESIAETLTINLATRLSSRRIGKKLLGAFRGWSRLQVNHACLAEEPLPFINEAHEDGNLLTLTCATRPGLEVWTRNNKFVSLTASPSELLIMPGEIAWLLSGGKIHPLHHRVRRLHLDRERLALLFFGDIDPQCCEPWISSEINRDVDIGARVVTSVNRFGLKGFSSEE